MMIGVLALARENLVLQGSFCVAFCLALGVVVGWFVLLKEIQPFFICLFKAAFGGPKD